MGLISRAAQPRSHIAVSLHPAGDNALQIREQAHGKARRGVLKSLLPRPAATGSDIAKTAQFSWAATVAQNLGFGLTLTHRQGHLPQRNPTDHPAYYGPPYMDRRAGYLLRVDTPLSCPIGQHCNT